MLLYIVLITFNFPQVTPPPPWFHSGFGKNLNLIPNHSIKFPKSSNSPLNSFHPSPLDYDFHPIVPPTALWSRNQENSSLHWTELLTSKIKFSWLFFSNHIVMISLKWKGPPFIWTTRETFPPFFFLKKRKQTKCKGIRGNPVPGLCL